MPNKTSFFELITHIPYLNILSEIQHQQIFEMTQRRMFTPHEMIFLEGDIASGLWIIETGDVKISRVNLAGDEYILHLLGAGDSFNDIAVLENSINPANATALTEAICWFIPTSVVQEMLTTYPQAAQTAIKMLTARVQNLVNQLESLALYSASARLARFLIQQAESSTPSSTITRVAMAAHLATTPETVSRALRSLEQAGAIEFDRHRIEIIKPDILRALAQISST